LFECEILAALDLAIIAHAAASSVSFNGCQRFAAKLRDD
jgi:hypothetical protein